MKNKKRLFVILFLILLAIYLPVFWRGQYLQIMQIGQEYGEVFFKNLKYKVIISGINFIFIFTSIYVTTKLIKHGLKKFFIEDKIEMPKLPNKSLALCFGVIIDIFTSSFLIEKIMLSINNTWFGISDPIYGLDIGFYVFSKPCIESILYYLIGIIAFLALYTIAYYLICFNKFFKDGVNVETLKKNMFIKQIVSFIIIAIILFSGINLLNAETMVLDEFIKTKDGTSLVGAGITDITIKKYGTIILSIVMVISAVLTAIMTAKKKFKKILIAIGVIPIYLIILFIVTFGFDLIYTKNDTLDKEKNFVAYNIEYTRKAYDINISEIEIEKDEDYIKTINNNENVIENINILNENTILDSLNEYQTNSGRYKFSSTCASIYNINGEHKLIYISPREVKNGEGITYGYRTYQYTHGYGIVIASASVTDENGKVKYLQNGFDDDEIQINEKRIYFGKETNNAIIVNEDEDEYDYPSSTNTNNSNSYNGKAGLHLNFLDRLILAINEGNFGLIFSNKRDVTSKVITKRNIIDRAETIMPYLTYDEDPYIVVTNEGNLIWVLDAYTTTNNYPYSQRTTINENGENKSINYIRNSVKVIMDAYNGNIEFYITDTTDPIIIAYRNLYPNVFKDYNDLSTDIKDKFVYSDYLFDIQKDILKMYHNTQTDIVYRADNVWEVAKENTSNVSMPVGTQINSYYTMLKTIDSKTEELGLVIPYTIKGKQAITSYLVGTNSGLKLYKFSSEDAILGTMQLENLIEEDETISAEIEKLDVTGSKIMKNTIIVPIDNTLLYVVPIYQVSLNEKVQIPTLKKVVVACENKIAIGNNLEEAFNNLLSQEAVSFEVKTMDDMNGLIKEIINANDNLKNSMQTNNWEMFGKDLSNLEELIDQLEVMNKTKNEETDENSVEQGNLIIEE